MTFNEQGTKNAIMENTPICEDAINIIMGMLKPPTFEVGKIYYQEYHWSSEHGGMVYKYKVLKRTKCFITIQDTNIYNMDNKPRRHKIKINEYHNKEEIEINYNYLSSTDEWDEKIHTIVEINEVEKVVRKGEELNYLLPKTKPPRFEIVNGVFYTYPTIKLPNPRILKITEEMENKKREVRKLEDEIRELDIKRAVIEYRFEELK